MWLLKFFYLQWNAFFHFVKHSFVYDIFCFIIHTRKKIANNLQWNNILWKCEKIKHTSNHDPKFCVFPNDSLLFSRSFMFGKWLRSLPCYEMVKHIWVPDFCSRRMIKIMIQDRIWQSERTPWRLASRSHSLLKVGESKWPFWQSHRIRKAQRCPLPAFQLS